MIISFSVTNFRSFRERQTLNLHVEQGDELAQNIAYSDKEGKIPVLRTAAVYGANASGKSNLLRAMLCTWQIILNSQRFDRNASMPFYEPFALDEESQQKPVEFSLDFIAFGTRYRYAFAYTASEIVFEELAVYASNKEAVLFSRTKGDDVNSMKMGRRLTGQKRKTPFMPHQLYLSVAANTKGSPEVLGTIWDAFNSYMFVNLNNMLLPVRANILLETPEGRQKLVNFLKAVDTGIESMSVEKNDEQILNAAFGNLEPYTRWQMFENNKYKIRCGHKNSKGEIVYFDLNNESVGTGRFLILVGHIYFALLRGEVLAIDELNNSLHPQLAEFLVELFNDPEVNSNNAQLIFTTHDITQMNQSYMRRDQLYFIDKNDAGESELYSLDEFSEVRKNTPFAKWYMQNRFQATPDIDYSALKTFLIQEVANASK